RPTIAESHGIANTASYRIPISSTTTRDRCSTRAVDCFATISCSSAGRDRAVSKPMSLRCGTGAGPTCGVMGNGCESPHVDDLLVEPLRWALDALPAPVTFFFRDDDIGWDDDRLLDLLDILGHHSLPVDLAAPPAAISIDLARTLRARAEASPELVAVHQHGFAHVNHEPEGRKCEFGPSRSAADQRRDIDCGRRRLADVFGPIVQPIFTPP